MKISIITPSLNQAGFIERTILSIWSQAGNFDIEHIIIDGGSTDETLDIIKEYDLIFQKNRFDFKCRNFTFQWISESDEGQSHAINKGFARSTGKIIGWLNSDDTFVNDESLAAVHDAFVASGADFVVGNFYCIDSNNKIIDCPEGVNSLDNEQFQKRIRQIPKYDIITQPACLFRRHVWEIYGIDQSFHYTMDWNLWIKAYKGGCRFFKIEKYIANNRLHDLTKTSSDNLNRFEEILRIFRDHNTWCLNRFYFTIYYQLLKLSTAPLLGPTSKLLILTGKQVRNGLIRIFKAY